MQSLKNETMASSGRRTVSAAALALAVITVVVASEEGSFDVSRVGDGLAETVSSERHVGDI
jgi:hypothetical protein